jgi:SAM-dependent methyltransferase
MNTVKKCLACARRLESLLGDLFMNVDTAHSPDDFRADVRGAHGDAHGFQTVAHSTVQRAARVVKPSPRDTVVVLGCGKGRVLCHFARLRVAKVICIEISPRLAKMAEDNASRLRGRKAPIEVRNADAAAADLSDASIVFMFNPFGESTLRDVLRHLEQSHKDLRRPLTIIYANPVFARVFGDFPWLKKTADMVRLTGFRTAVFEASY